MDGLGNELQLKQGDQSKAGIEFRVRQYRMVIWLRLLVREVARREGKV